MVGISFCLIIVRLGCTLPGVQDEDWHTSFCIPASRAATSGQIAVAFAQVKVRQDAYANEPKDCPVGVGTLAFQRQAYVGASDDSPKTSRSSLPLSTPTKGTLTRPGVQ